MKKRRLYFRAYLAALLMLAAVPAEAADVKELFAIGIGKSDVLPNSSRGHTVPLQVRLKI